MNALVDLYLCLRSWGQKSERRTPAAAWSTRVNALSKRSNLVDLQDAKSKTATTRQPVDFTKTTVQFYGCCTSGSCLYISNLVQKSALDLSARRRNRLDISDISHLQNAEKIQQQTHLQDDFLWGPRVRTRCKSDEETC
jgi:hypothetical protein